MLKGVTLVHEQLCGSPLEEFLILPLRMRSCWGRTYLTLEDKNSEGKRSGHGVDLFQSSEWKEELYGVKDDFRYGVPNIDFIVGTENHAVYKILHKMWVVFY